MKKTKQGRKKVIGALLFALYLCPRWAAAEPLHSPTWGFTIDLPEEFTYQTGNGRDRFSFANQEGAVFDLALYPGGEYPSPEGLAAEITRRLNNQGEVTPFSYRYRGAALMELAFQNPATGEACAGWGLIAELEAEPGMPRPLLLALTYGARDAGQLQALFFSALDSIAPSLGDRLSPGPITEFTYPAGERTLVTLANTAIQAQIRENDAEAAQALVDREFIVLRRYVDHQKWRDAWIRFYRAIHRDSYERLMDAAFNLERNWSREGDIPAEALKWVQSFSYERDLLGSDFVNLVTAAVEGRGDCDSRALLWAIMLEQANIPAAIMVSRRHAHAMGLADIPGEGARFELNAKKWLVAETTARVGMGMIAAENADPVNWIGVSF